MRTELHHRAAIHRQSIAFGICKLKNDGNCCDWLICRNPHLSFPPCIPRQKTDDIHFTRQHHLSVPSLNRGCRKIVMEPAFHRRRVSHVCGDAVPKLVARILIFPVRFKHGGNHRSTENVLSGFRLAVCDTLNKKNERPVFSKYACLLDWTKEFFGEWIAAANLR